MRRIARVRTVAACGLLVFGWLAGSSTAQLINLQTPIQNTSDSFFESTGTSGSFVNNDGTFFFNFGGGGNVVPPFGGFDPNSQATVGFRRQGSEGSFNLNFSFAQGSSRTNSVTTPSLTLSNGGTGSIINSTFRPFVTSVVPVLGNNVRGFVPVVSGFPSLPNPASQVTYTNPLIQKVQRLRTEKPVESPGLRALRERAKAERAAKSPVVPSPASSASYGDLSVAEIRASHAVEADTVSPKVAESITKADEFSKEGKLTLARYHYKYALKRAPESRKSELSKKLDLVEEKIYAQKQAAAGTEQ